MTRDVLGVPKARSHSYLDEGELHRLAFMAKTARAASCFEAVGFDGGWFSAIMAPLHILRRYIRRIF